MKRFTVLLAFFVFVGFQALQAQNVQITGNVTSADDGSPLPGTSVVVKGTTIGTVTNFNGDYELSVPQSATTLTFSFIGMKAQDVAIEGRKIIDLAMQADALGLEEIVVTAMGIRKAEKSLGYSATTINAEAFGKNSQIDAMNSLQGKVAGVVVSSGGGMPGASTKVIIRGYSSLSNNSPLYVVDGVPIDNSTRTNYNSGLDYGNRANDINPNDIESMTILKGASATALYGSKAAFGAVIITTKQGKASEKLKVEFNSSVSTSDILRLPQSQNTFGQGWSGKWSVDENGSWGAEMDGKIRAWGNVVDGAQKIKPFSPVKNNIYDFYDYGMQYSNSVNLSGGNEKSTFFLSYNNVSADGIIPTNVDKNAKNALSLSARTQGKKLSASTAIHYVNRQGSLVPDGLGGSSSAANLYSEILQIPRDFSIVEFKDYKNDPYNNLDNYFTPYAFNPYFAINENQSEFFENRLYGSAQLDYKLTEWLSATWRVGTDVSNFNRKDWEAIMKFTPGTVNDVKKVTPNPGLVYQQNRFTQELNSDFILNYNTSITSTLKLDGIVAFNASQREYKALDGSINSLVIPGFYNLSNTDGLKNSTTYESLKRQKAFFGTANLDYNGMVFLNLGARQEYSSTLPENANSYFYPSASVSLLVHEIFAPLKDKIPYFKLRASWGKAGNDAPVYNIDPYFTSAVVSIPYSALNFPLNGVGSFEKGNQIGNPYLTPEITTEAEIGADIRLLENRLIFDIALYNKISDGQILSVVIPPSSGFSNQIVNFGKVQNKGVEIAATVVPVKLSNFQWALSGTFTKNNNKVLDLPGDAGELVLTSVYGTQLVAIKGKPVGVLRTGDYVRDSTGHVIVNSTNGIPKGSVDKTEVGGVLPKFVVGITNSFSYKNFEFSFVIDWRKGGYLYSGTADLQYFVGNAVQSTYNNRQPFIVPNSVKDNPFYNAVTNPTVPMYVENDVPVDMNNYNAYYYPSSAPVSERNRIIPRDYVKLRDISVSYTVPAKLIANLPIEKISLMVTGRNLLLFTPAENNFIDPESTSWGNDLLSEFGEFRTGPTVRSFTGSIRINF